MGRHAELVDLGFCVWCVLLDAGLPSACSYRSGRPGGGPVLLGANRWQSVYIHVFLVLVPPLVRKMPRGGVLEQMPATCFEVMYGARATCVCGWRRRPRQFGRVAFVLGGAVMG